MLTFFVLGDWGRRGSDAQQTVADGMARAARRYTPAFVLTTGDNFYDHGVQDALDPHWHDSFDAVYTDPSLLIPWYAALGNHDHEGDVASQIAYTQHDSRWRMPGRYYSFNKRVDDRTHAQFVVLDTTPFTDPDARQAQANGSMGDGHPGAAGSSARAVRPVVQAEGNGSAVEQRNGRLRSPRTAFDPTLQRYWLQHMLAPSRSAWRLVVGHHPIRSGSSFHGATPALRQEVAPLLHSMNVHAYLCGHEHDLQHLAADGLHHVVSGAGSEVRETGSVEATRYSASTLGFAVVSLTADAMGLRFCDASGEVIYETLIDRVATAEKAA